MADEMRSRLGRGLASLIGDVGGEAAHVDRPRAQRKVPIEFLKPNPRNPRRAFSEAELGELADSIKQHGVIQPIVVLDRVRSEEHTSELQSHSDLVCRLLLEKKKKKKTRNCVVHTTRL